MFGKNLQLNPISIFLILTIMLIIPLPAQAGTHTWTGEANSLWSNAGNGSPSGDAHFAGIYIGMPNGGFFYVNRSDAHVPL